MHQVLIVRRFDKSLMLVINSHIGQTWAQFDAHGPIVILEMIQSMTLGLGIFSFGKMTLRLDLIMTGSLLHHQVSYGDVCMHACDNMDNHIRHLSHSHNNHTLLLLELTTIVCVCVCKNTQLY
mgnify:CR=1